MIANITVTNLLISISVLIILSLGILALSIHNAFKVKAAITRIKNKYSFYFILFDILCATAFAILLIVFWLSVNYGEKLSTYLLASIIFFINSIFIYIASIVTYRMGTLLERLDIARKLDPLTKIYNRDHIFKEIQNQFKRYKRYKNTSTLAIIDINQFKNINDTYGHQAGDSVILDLVRTVIDNCRDTDIFGRYGGDEFILILPETNLEQTNTFFNRLAAHIKKKQLLIHNTIITYSIAIGCAEITDGIPDYEEWIRLADKKMLSIKQNLQ